MDMANSSQNQYQNVSINWGDIFANYVAGNIDVAQTQGADMYNFITGVLP